MDKSTCSDPGNCKKAAQYLITIIIVLLVGKIISVLPIMTNVPIERGLFAADLVTFATKLAALILFYFFARHSVAALPDNGGAYSFVRGIAAPVTALVIIVLGQRLIWRILAPFIGTTGETIYFSLALLAIIAATIWLMVTAYRDAPYIINALQQFSGTFAGFRLPGKTQTCPDCGKAMAADAKFCPHCGQHNVGHDDHQCPHCTAPVTAEQKYCGQCGAPVDRQATDQLVDQDLIR